MIKAASKKTTKLEKQIAARKLKSTCCAKWRKKGKACSRCPLAALVGKKNLRKNVVPRDLDERRLSKDLAKELERLRRKAA